MRLFRKKESIASAFSDGVNKGVAIATSGILNRVGAREWNKSEDEEPPKDALLLAAWDGFVGVTFDVVQWCEQCQQWNSLRNPHYGIVKPEFWSEVNLSFFRPSITIPIHHREY